MIIFAVELLVIFLHIYFFAFCNLLTRHIYYFILKTNWCIQCKCIMQNEKSRIWNTLCCMIPFIWHSGKAELIRDTDLSVTARDWVWRERIDNKEKWRKFLMWWGCSKSGLFLFTANIPLYICTTSSLSIPLLMDI